MRKKRTSKSCFRDSSQGRKKSLFFSLAAFLVLAILAVAIFGTWAAPHDPLSGDPAGRLQPPSSEYLLGTDALGRCLLSRILCGAKTSVGLGFAVVIVSCLVGTMVGLVAGYAGGMCDEALMRITDVFFSFPEIIAAMAIAGIAGPGTANLLLALSIVSWMRYARLVRGISLSARQRDYVEAARLSGVSHLVVIFRHILPASVPSLIVLSTISLAKAIMAVSALGFPGLRSAPALSGMGLSSHGGQRLHSQRPPSIPLPGNGHHDFRPFLQPARRRSARHAGQLIFRSNSNFDGKSMSKRLQRSRQPDRTVEPDIGRRNFRFPTRPYGP